MYKFEFQGIKSGVKYIFQIIFMPELDLNLKFEKFWCYPLYALNCVKFNHEMFGRIIKINIFT